MVYEKTVLGCNEFSSTQRSLHFKERQLLLLMNGSRSNKDLEKLFKSEQLHELILKLESKGYIQRVGSNSIIKTISETRSYLVSDLPFITISPTQLVSIKVILINATDDYLGLMGRTLKEHIANCDDEISLKNCLSTWHMAMRESKLGRESTDFLMEQIHQILAGNMTDTDHHMH